MPKSRSNYWAFCANPQVYKIEDAVRELRYDDWTVPGKNVHAGDRAIIWKAKGRELHRGIVAFAEVLTDPVVRVSSNVKYWVTPEEANKPVEYVSVRYYVPPILPLWIDIDGIASSVLKTLSVARATGGTIFHVTPDQWNAVMAIIGGWLPIHPDIEDAEMVLAEAIGKRQAGQGFRTDVRIRRAIELYAMQKARRYYEEKGWSVRDVSAYESYDLHCIQDGGKDLRVEVKGTSSDGQHVFLTANEVRHAQRYYPNVVLFVVFSVQVDQIAEEETPQISGGEIRLLEPWKIKAEQLSPLTYTFTLLDE